MLLFFFFLSLQCACFLKMPPPPAQKVSFVITGTEEEEGQRREEELVVVLLVTKKRQKAPGGKGGNRKERKAARMAEHVRSHMTAVPVSGSAVRIFTVRLQGGRERERKRGERWRARAERGFYAGAGSAGTPGPRLLSAPRPISARERWAGRGRGGGLRSGGEGGGRGGERRRPGLEGVLEAVLSAEPGKERPGESSRCAGDFPGRCQEAGADAWEARGAGLPGPTSRASLARPVGLG